MIVCICHMTGGGEGGVVPKGQVVAGNPVVEPWTLGVGEVEEEEVWTGGQTTLAVAVGEEEEEEVWTGGQTTLAAVGEVWSSAAVAVTSLCATVASHLFC